jgi:AraC-like DNA-binding protein
MGSKRMRAIPLVRSSVLHPLFEFLARRSCALPAPLVRARRALADSDPPIPLACAGSLFEEAVRATGCEDLGLCVGRASEMDALGDLGPALRRSATLAEAIAIAELHLTRRFDTGERIWLGEQSGHASLCRWFSPALRRGRQAVSDYSLMFMLKVLRLAAGPRWRPVEIDLEGPRPAHAARLDELAYCVRFEQPVTRVLFPRELLALPLVQQVSARDARSLALRAVELPLDFEGSVRGAIAALLQLGRPDLRSLAEAAGTSVRSLQRGLSRSGLQFTELVDEARFERARRLLRDAARVVDVVADLGYTDAGNFSRAFRRWSGGQSPREFRLSLERDVPAAG